MAFSFAVSGLFLALSWTKLIMQLMICIYTQGSHTHDIKTFGGIVPEPWQCLGTLATILFIEHTAYNTF